jgi:hypothetical protein
MLFSPQFIYRNVSASLKARSPGLKSGASTNGLALMELSPSLKGLAAGEIRRGLKSGYGRVTFGTVENRIFCPEIEHKSCSDFWRTVQLTCCIKSG